MFARTFICAALIAATATACSSSTTAAKTSAAAPGALSTTATAPPASKLDAAGIAAKLKAAGVPIGTVLVYTAASDPNHLLGRPGGYTSKVAFTDTRINPKDAKGSRPDSIDLGGSVEVFTDAAGAQARADYGRKVRSAMPMLGTEYDYLSGPVLLRVSQLLTPDQAAAYQKALG